MKHRSHTDFLPHPRRFSLAFVSLLAGAILAGCSQLSSGTATDQAAARATVLTAVDDAFAGAAEADAEDLASAGVLAALAAQTDAAQTDAAQTGGAQTGGAQAGGAQAGAAPTRAAPSHAATAAARLGTADVEPLLVIRRVRMHRQRELLTLTYDGTTEPATATAEVAIEVTGTAQIWRVFPDLSLPRTLVGEKPIDLSGRVGVSLVHGAGGWHLTAVDSAGLTQGANAATVEDVLLDPDPLMTGSRDNLAYVTLSEPDTTDDFLVAARGRHLHPHGVLGDDGLPPDASADDDVYSGNVWVGEVARPGTHLAFITALDYSRSVNLTTTEDRYDDPYTDTVQPVLVELAAGE